jgi:hypothetical protein
MISLVLIMILFWLIITVSFQSRHVRFPDVEFLWIWLPFPHALVQMPMFGVGLT